MNTVLKKFIVFGLAAIILVNPFFSSTTASAATIQEWFRSDEGRGLNVIYTDQSPLVIEKGNSGALVNIGNNGRFNVAAGDQICFLFHNLQQASYKYSIINANTGQVFETGYYFDSYGELTVSEVVQQTGQYVIILAPIGNPYLIITDYYVHTAWY